MIQFYAPDIKSTLTLPESDSAHCVRVLRLREGDTVYAVDGMGTRYECIISEAHPKHTRVEIVSSISVPSHWGVRITLAVCPTKNMDRMEWLLEKAAELGVDRIVPVKCSRSERKVIKLERMEKILVSAMKQSLKGVLPELSEMTPIEDFLANAPEGRKFIGYCDKNIDRKLFAKEYKAGSDVCILVGPEGDFTPEEVQMAIAKGFVPVSFGDSRLRTETAALFGVMAVHVINQEHS